MILDCETLEPGWIFVGTITPDMLMLVTRVTRSRVYYLCMTRGRFLFNSYGSGGEYWRSRKAFKHWFTDDSVNRMRRVA